MGYIEHTENTFEQFKNHYDNEVCPCDGVITYVDDKVMCSKHKRKDAVEDNATDDDNDEQDDGSVPFL